MKSKLKFAGYLAVDKTCNRVTICIITPETKTYYYAKLSELTEIMGKGGWIKIYSKK